MPPQRIADCSSTERFVKGNQGSAGTCECIDSAERVNGECVCGEGTHSVWNATARDGRGGGARGARLHARASVASQRLRRLASSCPDQTIPLSDFCAVLCKLCKPELGHFCKKGVLAPLPGYWNSCPNSEDVQPCPNRQACLGRDPFMGENRTGACYPKCTLGHCGVALIVRNRSDLTRGFSCPRPVRPADALITWQLDYSIDDLLAWCYGGPPTAMTALLPGDQARDIYIQWLCLNGYRGPLCGVCENGYGRTRCTVRLKDTPTSVAIVTEVAGYLGRWSVDGLCSPQLYRLLTCQKCFKRGTNTLYYWCAAANRPQPICFMAQSAHRFFYAVRLRSTVLSF